MCLVYHRIPHQLDKVLRAVAHQPEEVYNALDVSGVTLIKASDALALMVNNS